MNFGVFAPMPQCQTPPLSSAAIKTLCKSGHQQLPLQFRVTSTTIKKDFVVYNCDVSSVTTSNSWSVSYRYSKFAAFRKEVEDKWTCRHPACCGSCEAIREVLWACFPHKRFSILSKSTRTISDRRDKFEIIVQYLLRCVLLPGSAMKCLYARRNLPMNLFKFLGVESDADKRSVLQVFVDNHHQISSKCTFHFITSTVDAIEVPQCMICLDEVGPSSSIILPCQHVFHRKCTFEWLLSHFRCPVCRARIGPSAVASYCRQKDRVLQWWLNDFLQDPLLIGPEQVVMRRSICLDDDLKQH